MRFYKYLFILALLSLICFFNFRLFLLSEEFVVFISSVFFLILAFFVLRKSVISYFFNRAYLVYVTFLYLLLLYKTIIEHLNAIVLVLSPVLASFDYKKNLSILVIYSNWLDYIVTVNTNFLRVQPHYLLLSVTKGASNKHLKRNCINHVYY